MRRLLLLLIVLAGCASPRLGAYYPPSQGAWLTLPIARPIARAGAPGAPRSHAAKSRHNRHSRPGRPSHQRSEMVAPTPETVVQAPTPAPLPRGRAERLLQKLTRPAAPASPTNDGLGRMILVVGVLLGLTILALVLALAFPGTVAGIIGLVLLLVLFGLVVIPLLLALRH